MVTKMALPWIKHYTNLQESEVITKIMAKGGVEAYGRYWLFLEALGRKMDFKDQVDFIFSTHEIKQRLAIYHTRSLRDWLQSLSDLGLISFQFQERSVLISTRILLKLKDKDWQRTRQGREYVEHKRKEIKKREKKKNNIKKAAPKVAVKFDLDKIYNAYPRKKGKAAGLKKLQSTIKTLEQYEAVMAGVERYATECAGKEQQYIKHFSTWVNQEGWHDGLDQGESEQDRLRRLIGGEDESK